MLSIEVLCATSVVSGRLFEGGPEIMLKSLDILCQLPDDTLLWPGLLLFNVLSWLFCEARCNIFDTERAFHWHIFYTDADNTNSV